MDVMDEDFYGKTSKCGKKYNSSDAFLEDMRKGELIEGFFLTEDAFQQIVGEVASDKKVAADVHENAIVIAIKADKGQELGGILELAESFSNG